MYLDVHSLFIFVHLGLVYAQILLQVILSYTSPLYITP